MLIPKKARVDILSYLFKEGVLVAEKNLYAKHPDIEGVSNLYVINVMKSMRSRKFVRESFTWNHYYWYLNNEGINYLREFLHLPEEIVPATLKKKPTQLGERMERDRPFGGRGGGDRPGGFRGTRPFGQQKDAGVDADFKPSFGGNKPTGMGRGGSGQ